MVEGRLRDCRRVIKEFHLDFLCMLETKLHQELSQEATNHNHINLFPHEETFSKFDSSLSGRILLNWNSDSISFSLLLAASQFIHGEINLRGSLSFYITCVYGSKDAHFKRELWHFINTIANTIYGPWIIMGDFNYILTFKEKLGGNPTPTARMADFRDCVTNAGLIELSHYGQNYTLPNLQSNNLIRSKIDRMLHNHLWLQAFPTSYYRIAPPLSSDHNPLILFLDNSCLPKHKFIFKNHWTLNTAFTRLVSYAWNFYLKGDAMFVLSKKLSVVRDNLKNHIWETSPLVDQLKEFKLLKNAALVKLDRDPHNETFLRDFHNINSHYADIARKESMRVKQRAKFFWLSHADDNLKYLYNSITERRHINLIKEIHLNGDIITNSSLMGNAFCNFYEKLFNQDHTPTFLLKIFLWAVHSPRIKQACLSCL